MKKNKIKYMQNNLKKLFLITLLVMIMSMPLSYSLTAFSDVPKTHWIYSTLQEMLSAGIIKEAESFKLGSGITETELADILKAISPEKSSINTTNSTRTLTRKETLLYIFKTLEYDKLASQLKELKSPYIDTVGDSSMYQIAAELGWISVNGTKTFRPDQLMKKEEAYALLNNIYKGFAFDLNLLHSYYAISSYNQIGYNEDMNSLSFGWSRLEFNSNKTDVILNMTSTNANEYRVPTGYSSSIEATTREGLSRQLMVFVKNESIVNADTGKTMTLTESIINDAKLADSVIASIMNALDNNSYKIPFDGVVIDFEGLKGAENAEKLNTFLSKLDTQLEAKAFSLYVAVHPERKVGLEYYDGYDFKTIGEYADYVILMAHDYYPKKLTPSGMAIGFTVTPLAAINEVYYALSAIVDKEEGVTDRSKVLLQFSMDTVQWKVQNGVILNDIPYHPTYKAIALRIDSGIPVTYSSNLQSPYLSFVDSDGIKNVIWYEDERSIQAKIDLAKFFKIGGLSVWRLGTIPDLESQLNTEMKVWQQILENYKTEIEE